MIIYRWEKGLWTAGPPCSAPPNTLTRMINMQVNDEGVVQTRPGSVAVTGLANTVDGTFIAGMHFYKLASGEIYRDVTDLGFTQIGMVPNTNYLRAAAMTAFGIADDIVFFPICMKKYWAATGTASNWGISEVPNVPTLSTSVAGNLTGTYTYKTAFYNSVTKTLGALSDASASLTVSGRVIRVSSIPATCADPQADFVRIFRTLGGITGTWYFVDEVALGTTFYEDNIADAGLGDAIDPFYIVPPTANVAGRYKSRMLLFDIASATFGGPRYGYASLGSQPEGFLSNLYELVADAGDTIQGVQQIGDYLYVFGQQRVYNFQISTTGVIQVATLPTAVGTMNGRTVCMGGQGVYYAASDGIYLFQGFTPVLVSDQIDALFRGTDRGGLSTIADWDLTAACFVGGRYYFSYYGGDAVWHTAIYNERKNRWKHYTGWKWTTSPGLGVFPYVGLSSSVSQALGTQTIFTDDGTAYTSECGFNIPMPMTELNEVRGFRMSASCAGPLTVSFYDSETLIYSVTFDDYAFTDGWNKHSLPNGSYFADPEVRISSASNFTLRMFEPTVTPVRKVMGEFTRSSNANVTGS